MLCFNFHRENENGEVWYYSTPLQFDELMNSLDRNEMEVALYRELSDYKDEIIRQMEITETLTNQFKGNKKSYLEIENALILRARKEKEEKQEKEQEEKKEKERQEAEDMVRRIHEGSDSLEERLAVVSGQKEAKVPSTSMDHDGVSDSINESVDESRHGDESTEKGKNGKSGNSDGEIDEEAMDCEEKTGKDGKKVFFF